MVFGLCLAWPEDRKARCAFERATVIRRAIAFGIQAAGCLYAGYWAIFFGSVAFLIITSYLHEHKHHPAGKPASHEASVTTRK